MTAGQLRPCPPDDAAFLALVGRLDAYLAVTDGDEHGFYAQFNAPATLDYALVLERDGVPVACGGLRARGDDAYEVKRMFVAEDARGHRLAVAVLRALETEARARGARRVVLETGLRQSEAVRLYTREGYRRVPNFPPYEAMANSACFERALGGV